MLKKICGLFLGLVVCAGSACVTPTHASSAVQGVVISYIQAAGNLGAMDEVVVIHNNTNAEVEITDWCLKNKYGISFACFTTTADGSDRFYLPAYQSAVVASEDHVFGNGYAPDAYTVIYPVTNQSSGSLVSGSDALSLVASDGSIVDSNQWPIYVGAGKALARIQIAAIPKVYMATQLPSDWIVQDITVPPYNAVEIRVDSEGEIPTPPETPVEPETPADESTLPPMITEIFANAKGSDDGNEFIELYNPSAQESIALNEFTLQVGISSVKSYSFPIDAILPPLGYVVFTNSDIPFTLVNTTGRVEIIKDAAIVASVDYSNPKEDYSWALIGGSWLYSTKPTPGFANQLVETQNDTVIKNVANTARKPCAKNQYRNPATGRCKLIATAKAPTPCKAGQVRNAETNRCRNIAVATQSKPCKEGQERNPETGRCRTIVKMSQAGYGVKGVQSVANAQMQWYYWVAIAGVVALILAYAVWEWRTELQLLWKRMTALFVKNKG